MKFSVHEPKPMVPARLAPWVAFVTIVAGAALVELEPGTPLFKACRVILAVGAAYGAVSPGWWRR